jgi:hypothetical protein
MPLRLALVATKIGGGSTEIAMIMIAPSAAHGFGKWVPEIVTRLPVPWPHCVVIETQYPEERAGRTISRKGRAGRAVTCRRASRTIADRRGIATAGGSLLALIWAVEIKLSYIVLN